MTERLPTDGGDSGTWGAVLNGYLGVDHAADGTNKNVLSGTGSPEGAVTGTVGMLFRRTDGGSGTSLYVKESGSGNTGWTAVAPGAAGAPTTATYITQTANGSLSAEQAMGALGTGLVKNTTTTGVQSIAAAGTDYYAPGSTDVAVADGGTGASTAAAGLANLGGVAASLYDANTVLAATTDDTPAAITMAASTILARLAAGNIKAASVAEIVTLLAAYVSGGTDVAVADGGTGASTAAAALTNLGAQPALITTNRQTASYTLVAGDAGLCVEMNVASGNTLTVPPNSSVAFATGTVVAIHQYGAGQTTVTAGAGVTIRSPAAHIKLTGQYSSGAIRKVGTDEWILTGDLSA